MKTSTKLLIALFLCIPITLAAFNVLLKKELLAGNITQIQYTNNDYQVKQLSAFKYLVIDGALVSGDTITKKGYKKDVDWMPRIGVNITANKGNNMRVMKPYSDILKTTVKNDTLFISFYKKVSGERNYYSSYPNENLLEVEKMLEINAPQLYTIKSRNAGVVITTFKNHTRFDSLEIASTGRGKFDVNFLAVKKLKVLVKGTAQLCIYDNNYIGDLQYSILQRGVMNVEANAVQHFNAGKTDSQARISINGKVNDLKKMLE